jgi:hypothetical protein
LIVPATKGRIGKTARFQYVVSFFTANPQSYFLAFDLPFSSADQLVLPFCDEPKPGPSSIS